MCPAGMVLAETLLAWSMAQGQWVPVDLCIDKEDIGHVIRTDFNEECDIYQAVVPKLGPQWFIQEDKDESKVEE